MHIRSLTYDFGAYVVPKSGEFFKNGGLSKENKIQTQSASKGLKYNCLSGSSNSSHDNNNNDNNNDNDNENDIIWPLDYNFIQVK